MFFFTQPGAGQTWSREKCEELAKEVVEQFDRAMATKSGIIP